MTGPVPPFDFSKLTRESLAERGGKVTTRDFARPTAPNATFGEWLDNLPGILAGRDFHALVEAIAAARAGLRPFHLALGAHVVKVGLGPVLVDLIERGIVTAVTPFASRPFISTCMP